MLTEIKLTNACKHFSSMSRPALSDVSLSFISGRVTAIVGPNGAGKTTLLKVIAGLVDLDGGEVSFLNAHAQIARPSVALVLDGGKGFYGRLSVLENFRYFLGIASGETPYSTVEGSLHWLKKFHLEDKAHAVCQTLSRGMLQRLSLAVATASNARIILLDEPTNGLDIAETLSFFEIVQDIARTSGAAIIVNSHQPETILGLANEVFLLKAGRICGVINQPELESMNPTTFVHSYLDAVA